MLGALAPGTESNFRRGARDIASGPQQDVGVFDDPAEHRARIAFPGAPELRG